LAAGASQSSVCAVIPPSTHVHSIFWYVNVSLSAAVLLSGSVMNSNDR
jgi:hypothetical protein